MKKNRIVFACDTPLQILNAINLKESYYSGCEGDIFIYDQFRGAERVADRLKESNIFENVFVVRKYKDYSIHFRKLVTLKRMLFPYTTLKKYIREDCQFQKRNYECVVFSFITTFSLTVFGMTNRAQFVLLEDGIGTYVGNILNDYTSRLFKKIIAHTVYKKIEHPEKIAVYSKELYQGNVPVLELNREFAGSVRDKIQYVYEYSKNDMYTKKKVVYLTQPICETKGYDTFNYGCIKNTLEKYKCSLLLRVHPREQEENYENFEIDSINNLWELECIQQITDDNILIGVFSTTQIMPKILTNKEPYLLFLYKLVYKEESNKNWKDWEKLIDLFRKMYKDSKKILVPKSINEFEKILSENLVEGSLYETKK